MTHGDSDLDIDDRALAEMTHGKLVALLNRLYTRLGEKRVSTSTALASTDDELRDSIQAVRWRLASKLGQSAGPAPLPAQPTRARELPAGPADEKPPSSDRVFVVLLSRDSALVERARVASRSRGVTLVAVASRDSIAALVANVTPSHVVIEGPGFEPALVRDLETRGIRVRICQGPDQTLQALSQIG